MDPVRIIAERKLEEALSEGIFDNLPRMGRIDCSLQGEMFFAKWWREKIARDEEKQERPQARARGPFVI